MLKTILKICLLLMLGTNQIFNAAFAKPEPLRISVTYFTPPFIVSNGYKNFMGFDVNMLAYICYYLQRDCKFQAMQFDDLLPSVISKQADIAVGGIIITPQRLLKVAMSNPYLVSSSRFITNQEKNIPKLTEDLLKNSRIGVEKGSAFGEQINTWRISGVKIVEFKEEAGEIEALIQKKIDFALMDNFASIYWVNHSENKLKLIGKKINYGYGYGIAINPQNKRLIYEVNQAINAYINSNQYKQNYNLYLSEF